MTREVRADTLVDAPTHQFRNIKSEKPTECQRRGERDDRDELALRDRHIEIDSEKEIEE